MIESPEYELEIKRGLAEIEKSQERSNDLYLAATTYRELATCYRVGKRPTEKLFASLEKANEVMEAEQ